ncbi:MAG TPA: ABC transporter permease [Thermoanaerobaculia bacterium]|nr:ABC transporter permease [Thermoanaerobaculia bacterium]
MTELTSEALRSATDLPAEGALDLRAGTGEARSGSVLRVVRFQVLRNAKIFLYFKVHAGLQLLQVVAQLLVFLFLGELIGAQRFEALAGGTYASFLVIGMVVLQLLDKSLIGPFTSLSSAYWSSRLESLMLSPHSVWVIISSDTVWYYLMTTVNAVVILGIGFAFGADLHPPSSWPVLALLLILGSASVFGLGLASASTFSLLNAKGKEEPISWAVHLLQGLVCGLYFPFELLPRALKLFGLGLPHTYAIDAARRLFMPGYTEGGTLPVHRWLGLDPLAVDCLCLALATLVFLPLGVLLFNRGLRKSQEVGSLSRWT